MVVYICLYIYIYGCVESIDEDRLVVSRLLG